MAKPRSRGSGAPAAQRPRRADADAELFRAAMSDVKPLPPPPEAAGLGAPRPRRAAPRARSAALAAFGQLPGESSGGDAARDELSASDADASQADASQAGVAPGDALCFRRPGVRTQTLRRLRRGLCPVEDALDLHGLSQPQARDCLAEFIARSRSAGRHCVRVVHGKGYRSGARGPVLKIAVNRWLRHHPGVLAFTSARPLDGGTGAVYVLLRS